MVLCGVLFLRIPVRCSSILALLLGFEFSAMDMMEDIDIFDVFEEILSDEDEDYMNVVST